jgi:hypothetical protein
MTGAWAVTNEFAFAIEGEIEMTTPAAERLYLAQHLHHLEGRGWTVFNPNSKPLEELPVIYGFNNGGSPGWYSAVAISEDGHCLGGHLCSHEGYMEHDLGILEGAREDRHEKSYRKHYPGGYRMEFVSSQDIPDHAALNKAFDLNKAMPAPEAAEVVC